MTAKMMWIHCLSPLHAGVGQGVDVVDVVDLAIARDRATGYPYLPGSSIKGSLRDQATRSWGPRDGRTITLFGPDTANASEHAGALAFGDANLLCLPVRSMKGTFAWVTSPYLLRRLLRDAREAGVKLPDSIPLPASVSQICVGNASVLAITQQNGANKVYFEDLDFDAKVEPTATALAQALAQLLFVDKQDQALFEQRFCVVHDDVMAFLSKHGTDVVTRVSIDPETRTAKDGQLWTEENLPSESILVSLVVHVPVNAHRQAAGLGELQELVAHDVQFGGKATVGRGRCRVVLKGGQA